MSFPSRTRTKVVGNSYFVFANENVYSMNAFHIFYTVVTVPRDYYLVRGLECYLNNGRRLRNFSNDKTVTSENLWN